MDWKYLANLLKEIFYNTNNIFLSVPTYISGLLFFLALFWSKKARKMNWLTKTVQEHPALIIMSILIVSVVIASHSLHVNKPLRFATPDELIPSVLQSKSIRIADLVREDFIIRDKTFDDCHLYGPAIIYFDRGLFVNNTTTGVGVEGGFIETTNRQISGAIVIQDCVIKNSTFHRIGFIGNAALIAKIKANTNFPQ